MAKPKTPNQQKAYAALRSRINKYSIMVQQIYDMLNLEASQIALRTDYDGSQATPFSFSNYPQTADAVNKLRSAFVSNIRAVIYTGTSQEWKESNLLQDLLVNKMLKYYGSKAGGKKHKVYYDPNSDALKAFQRRRDKGMNLSEKLWKQSGEYKTELENALSSGIEKGISAVTLSKRLSKYLQNFESLKKDYKEKYGKATDCHNCEYNSIRLARTEINMAYRTAEQERWKKLDFVVGYRIKLSKSHPRPDICDDLQGVYPKDFKFTGWHPNCFCYCIPVLKTEEEFWSDSTTSVNAPKGYPRSFSQWLVKNEDSIKSSEKKGTLPYFLRDNKKVYKEEMEKEKARTFLMSKEIVEELHSLNFNRFDAERYNHSAMKGFNLKGFDESIEKIGDEHEIYWSGKTISFLDNGSVSMNYKGLSSDDEDVELNRVFFKEGNRIIVDHALFDLPEELQGKGISKAIFRSLFSEYENMGVDEVRVKANIDVGGYCWAKYGFCAKTSEIQDLAKMRYDDKVITKEQYNIVTSRLKKMGDVTPMNYIASLDFGKEMLLGTHWNGFLRLNDLPQLNYLHDYVGLSEVD